MSELAAVLFKIPNTPRGEDLDEYNYDQRGRYLEIFTEDMKLKLCGHVYKEDGWWVFPVKIRKWKKIKDVPLDPHTQLRFGFPNLLP